MKIALDIDGVLADTGVAMRQRIAKEFGISENDLLPGESYNNVYKIEDVDINDRINARVREIYLTDATLYREAHAIEGSILGAHYLEPVAYITRRPEGNGIKEATIEWLDHLGYPDAPVFFIPKGTCKSTKAKELGVDILIEDSPHEITSCRENRLETIVMRYGYNDHIINDDTISVHSWEDILDWAIKKGGILSPDSEVEVYINKLMEGHVQVSYLDEPPLSRIIAKRKSSFRYELPGEIGRYITDIGYWVSYVHLDDFTIVFGYHRHPGGHIEIYYSDGKPAARGVEGYAYAVLHWKLNKRFVEGDTWESIKAQAFRDHWW